MTQPTAPMPGAIIRDEADADVQAIHDLTVAAFADHPVSRHTEQFIVAGLREAGALSTSLVAEVEGRVVGHVAFSPVSFPDDTPDWYGLGPLSVLPALQRRGIGISLMCAGLERIKARGGRGCVLVGPPEYYQRFGFQSLPQITHEGVPQELVLALPLAGPIPQGAAAFHPAFLATE